MTARVTAAPTRVTAAPAGALNIPRDEGQLWLAAVWRWASVASMTAAGLIVVSQIAILVVGLTLGPASITTATHTFKNGLAMLAMYALLLALTGLYAAQARSAGRLGLLGYLVAFLGTLMVAGDWWFESFVVPQLAVAAPEIMKTAPSGSLLAGAIATFGLFSAGWVLFGIATFRARVFSRAGAALMIIGGLIGILALSSPFQVPLALAVGWIGYSAYQRTRGAVAL
jgi:hypothetical protein